MEETRTATPVGVVSNTAAFTATDATLLFVVLIWGVNFAVVKSALAQLSPLAFNGWRFTSAALLLLAFFRLRGGDLRVTGREALALRGLGLIGNTAYQPSK